jgi:thermitase
VDLEPVIGQLLVAFEDFADDGHIADLLGSVAGEVVECFTVVDYCLVRISADLDVTAVAAALRESPFVRDAVPDFRRAAEQISSDSFDPYLPLQWGLSKIAAAKAWAKMGPETNRATIAVLDTGFDLSHPDLISVYVQTINAVNPGPSPLFPNPVLTGDPDHGTKVAGVLAALGDNFYGIAGVNKNWADLVLVQVFEPGLANPTARDSDVIRGIQLLPQGVRVANLSFAGPAYNPALCDALSQRSSVVFVAAAGNQASSDRMYPAACPSNNVLAVAATTSEDRLAVSSSRGSWVDIAAPGQGILTTIPGGLHASVSGTSVAAPHVAGVASLLAARNPGLSAATVASMVASSADPVLGGQIGGGRLNACLAMKSLVGGSC